MQDNYLTYPGGQFSSLVPSSSTLDRHLIKRMETKKCCTLMIKAESLLGLFCSNKRDFCVVLALP